jgi:hypothetical protein
MSAWFARCWPDALAAIVVVSVGLIPVDRYRSTASERAVEVKMRSVREAENRRARAEQFLPAWDPYQFGGRPYLAAHDSQVAYPPTVLLQRLPVPASFEWSLTLHLWIAGLGAYLAARQLEAGRLAALAAGLGVTLATVAAPAVDLPYSVEAQRLAWVPLTFALAMRSVERPRMPHPGLVAVVALALTTASVRTVVYVCGAAVAGLGVALMTPGSAIKGSRLPAQFAVLAVLAVGLSAFQTLPAARFWLVQPSGGFSIHDWTLEESSGLVTDKAPLDDRIAAILMPLRGHRTLTACTRKVDETDLLTLRIPSIGGFGGAHLADYARFVNIASGLYLEKPAVYAGLDTAGHQPSRPDLLRFLDIEYLIDCGSPDPDRWTEIARIDDVGVYRNRAPHARAVWTCPAQAVGRQELEYRLRRNRYDAFLTLHGSGPLVHVRWAPGVDDEQRAHAEEQFQIVPERFLGERTWQYELFDSSTATVQAIVAHPLVEDTAGIDRRTFAVVSRAPQLPAEPRTEWLIGAAPCAATSPAMLVKADRPGVVVVDVDAPADGLLVFSEPFYPLRSASVDGEPAAVRKVNMAFTGVPVGPGRHRVELRYDPRGFQAGWTASAAAAAIWIVGGWHTRSRRRLANG